MTASNRGLLAAAFLAATAAFAVPPPDFDARVEALFRAPLAQQMALSPDGRRVAYTLQAATELHVVILDLDHPGATVTLRVDEGREVRFSDEKQAAQLRFLRWATADRLVLAPTAESIQLPNGTQTLAPVMAVDADGRNPVTLIDTEMAEQEPPLGAGGSPLSESVTPYRPQMVSRVPGILGFALKNREQLCVQVSPLDPHLPPDHLSVNVRTGEITRLDALGPTTWGASNGRLPLPDDVRLEITRELARKFPQRRVAPEDWDPTFQNVLVSVTGGADPGRVFVYNRRKNLVTEIFRRAPWLNSENLNESRLVEFDTVNQVHLSAYVTWPNKSRLKPPPLLVRFPDGFPGYPQPEFDPEAQVFADLGFIVLRLNHRALRGMTDADRRALASGVDRVAVDDARAAIGWMAEHYPAHPFDRTRVVTLGRGFGGYLAMRALQLEPELFRCGLAIDAPMDLRTWLHPSLALPAETFSSPAREVPAGLLPFEGTDWSALSVVAHADALTQPVFLLNAPLKNQAIELAADRLRTSLKSLGRPPDYLELEPGFALGLPKARAAVYRRMEEFFNLNLYKFGVKIGPTKEVK